MRKQPQRTTWATGMNPTGRYVHMFGEEEKEKNYRNDNRDPYKRGNKNSSSVSTQKKKY
jgi:hypothetical protein